MKKREIETAYDKKQKQDKIKKASNMKYLYEFIYWIV